MDLEKSRDKAVPAASFAELLALVGACPFPERPAQRAAWPPIGPPNPVVSFASGTTHVRCASEVHWHARPSVSTSSKNKQGVACSAFVSCLVPLELIYTISAQRSPCAMAECHYKIVYVPADT